jgi:hemerythrin
LGQDADTLDAVSCTHNQIGREVFKMALLAWDEKYSVNHTEFDSHHKKLIELINRLHDAMKQGKGMEALKPILTELASYVVFHFSVEEQFLRSIGFPKLVAHKAQHEGFTKRVQQFQTDFRAGKITVSIELMTFLGDWLINHIMSEDKKYSLLIQPVGAR